MRADPETAEQHAAAGTNGVVFGSGWLDPGLDEPLSVRFDIDVTAFHDMWARIHASIQISFGGGIKSLTVEVDEPDGWDDPEEARRS